MEQCWLDKAIGDALLATRIDAIAVCRASVINVTSGAVSQGKRESGTCETGTDKVLGAEVTGCDVDNVAGVVSLGAGQCAAM